MSAVLFAARIGTANDSDCGPLMSDDPTIPSLILDILETWCGDWFTPEQIISNTTRIRPEIDVGSVRRAITRVQTDGGGWFGNGRRPDTAMWMRVECKSDPMSDSTDFGFLLRIPWRANW